MSKRNCVVSCPADTYSGYGARSRDFVKALIKAKPDWDVKILSQRWGNTRFGYLKDHKEDDLSSRIIPGLDVKPDVWVQITIPNEFQAVGNYNIGVTAAVETNLMDADGGIGMAVLFIPEQWSMPPYIDDYGNSLIDEAIEAIVTERARWKNELSGEQYQLRISQKPLNIAEAFAYRKESVFPQGILSKQQKRIQEKEYPYELIKLDRDEKGIFAKRTNKLPITRFPVDKKQTDKTGTIVVWERPVKNPEFGAYYASIDPVSEGKTTTSDSLCSIFVYKNATEVTRTTAAGDVEQFI